MIKEHDRVVLRKVIPDQGLKVGDVGTVVHVHKKGEAFEVEFLTLHGETVAIATLAASQVRPIQKREITHARLLRA
jgi:glycerol dehydrogenase-like iron-containing ADH family enzyme